MVWFGDGLARWSGWGEWVGWQNPNIQITENRTNGGETPTQRTSTSHRILHKLFGLPYLPLIICYLHGTIFSCEEVVMEI